MIGSIQSFCKANKARGFSRHNLFGVDILTELMLVKEGLGESLSSCSNYLNGWY